MKRWFLVLVGTAVLLSIAAVRSSPAEPTGTALLRLPRATGTGQLSLFGHIKALAKKGSRYELRFDPAFVLTGVTASRAAVEDKVLRPGEPVPNDYYIRDETHKLLTYLVPAGARVTVLVNPGTGPRPATITVAELSQIVKGRNPKGRPLYDTANGLGYWALVDADTVRSLDQQYQP